MNARAFLCALAGLACTSPFATEPPPASPPAAFHELMALLAARRQGHVRFIEVHDGGSLALTLASLAIADLATVLASGVLASSRLPMPADLGAAVAPGAFLALLFSAMLSSRAAGEDSP